MCSRWTCPENGAHWTISTFTRVWWQVTLQSESPHWHGSPVGWHSVAELDQESQLTWWHLEVSKHMGSQKWMVYFMERGTHLLGNRHLFWHLSSTSSTPRFGDASFFLGVQRGRWATAGVNRRQDGLWQWVCSALPWNWASGVVKHGLPENQPFFWWFALD